jgi:predicted transcriptional regulator
MTKPIEWADLQPTLGLDEAELATAVENQYHRIFGFDLKQLRQQSEITQQQLASKIDTSQAMVSKIESGQLSKTQIATLQKYVEALGGTLRVSAEFGATHFVLI